MEPADRDLAPAIAADVDQDADEPGLFVRRAVRHSIGRAGRTEKGLLDEVAGIFAAARQPPRQPEQPGLMGVEQRSPDRAAESSFGRSVAAASTRA